MPWGGPLVSTTCNQTAVVIETRSLYALCVPASNLFAINAPEINPAFEETAQRNYFCGLRVI